MKEKIIGFTAGTFDMFHIGHLNLLRNARSRCDYLIVGVNSDRLVEEYKHKRAVVPLEERMEIVGALRCVDEVMKVDSLDKAVSWKKKHYNLLFIGDDWKGNERWKRTESEMQQYGVTVVYLPHTEGTNSTLLREKLVEY